MLIKEAFQKQIDNFDNEKGIIYFFIVVIDIDPNRNGMLYKRMAVNKNESFSYMEDNFLIFGFKKGLPILAQKFNFNTVNDAVGQFDIEYYSEES